MGRMGKKGTWISPLKGEIQTLCSKREWLTKAPGVGMPWVGWAFRPAIVIGHSPEKNEPAMVVRHPDPVRTYADLIHRAGWDPTALRMGRAG